MAIVKDFPLMVKNFKQVLKEERENLQEDASMSRQHFQLIAQVIHNMNGSKTRDQMAVAFAEALEKTNPNFNRTFFLNACKYRQDRDQ